MRKPAGVKHGVIRPHAFLFGRVPGVGTEKDAVALIRAAKANPGSQAAEKLIAAVSEHLRRRAANFVAERKELPDELVEELAEHALHSFMINIRNYEPEKTGKHKAFSTWLNTRSTQWFNSKASDWKKKLDEIPLGQLAPQERWKLAFRQTQEGMAGKPAENQINLVRDAVDSLREKNALTHRHLTALRMWEEGHSAGEIGIAVGRMLNRKAPVTRQMVGKLLDEAFKRIRAEISRIKTREESAR